jgi:polyisoprenoid-binding protein YceI
MQRDNRFQTVLAGGAAALALATFSLVAAARLNKTGDAEGGFHAKGPAGFAIDGHTNELAVADDGTSVTITITLTNIKTGSDLRDSHTKEDLEVSKYSTATLKVPRSALKMGGGDGDTTGSFTIHGVTKDASFHYSASKNGDQLDVKGTTTINVNDYGVKPRSYLSISIKPDVAIYANFSVKDN